MIKEKKTDEKSRGHVDMSETAKKFKRSPAVFIGTVVVLILVIVSFVFWGAGEFILPNSSMFGDDPRTFGYYGKTAIALTPGSFFSRQRTNYINWQQQQGYYKDEQQATKQAFEDSAVRIAVLDMMKKAGYEPPKTVIDKKVAGLERYKENGKFSVLLWRQDSPARRLEIQNLVKEDYIISRYYADAALIQSEEENSNPDVSIEPKSTFIALSPSGEADFIAALGKKKRTFKMAVFPFSAYPDSEIKSYAEKNAAAFKELHLSVITVVSSKDAIAAQKVLEAINSGSTTFEDAVKTYSEDEYKQGGGDMGKKMVWELSSLIPDEADRNKAAALAKGALSEPIKLSSGWGIFRAEADAAEAALSESAVLQKIRGYMTAEQRGIVEDWLIAKAAGFKKDAEEGSWEAALGSVNDALEGEAKIESRNFGPVPLNYGDSTLFARIRDFASEAPELQAASESENFLKIAFSTPLSKISAPFVINADQQNVVVLSPTEESSDEDAVANTVNLYKSDYLQSRREVLQNADKAILNGGKFKDNFSAKYSELFAPAQPLF